MKKAAAAMVEAIVGEERLNDVIIEVSGGEKEAQVVVRAPSDILGAIIGREGRTAKAMRWILNIQAKRLELKKFGLEVTSITKSPIKPAQPQP